MANDNRIDGIDFEERDFDDEEMSALFASFDTVSASDQLKRDTLTSILALAEEPANATQTSKGRSTTSRKQKWRAFRIAAIAACLTLALSGGAAYAIPSSQVTVSQDGSSIELGVNIFGITVDAKSDDETGREVIDETDLKNVPYEESLDRAYNSFEKRNPGKSFDIDVKSGPFGQRDRLESESNRFMEAHPTPDGSSPNEMQPDANGEMQPYGNPGTQPEGNPGAQAGGNYAPQPGAQPGSQPASGPSGQPDSQQASEPSGQLDAQPKSQPSGQPDPQLESQPSTQSSGQLGTWPESSSNGQAEQPDTRANAQSGDRIEPQSQLEPQSVGQASGQPNVVQQDLQNSQSEIGPDAQACNQANGGQLDQLVEQPGNQPSNQQGAQQNGNPSGQMKTQ